MFVSYAQCNSSWTYNHMVKIWTKTKLDKVYPPCSSILLIISHISSGTQLTRSVYIQFTRLSGLQMIIFVIAILLLVVVHELIHGITWSVFTEHHFGDIEFGFMKEYLTPYCTCKCPLSKGKYIIGALMPLIILGIIPMAAGIIMGSMLLGQMKN